MNSTLDLIQGKIINGGLVSKANEEMKSMKLLGSIISGWFQKAYELIVSKSTEHHHIHLTSNNTTVSSYMRWAG